MNKQIQLGQLQNNYGTIHKQIALPTAALKKHTAVIGMTGSGKSGLLLSITEELADVKVPVILVDIKGDMGNIALQQMSTPNIVYRCLTPGSMHGESINVFADLSDPSKVPEAVSMLLTMAGENADPLQSKAHAYISSILINKHKNKESCSLYNIVQAVQNPGFESLGAMDLDYAFPKKARTTLASKLNNILIAPTFKPWREGIPLDIDELLHDEQERTPIIIYSVAHLVNQEDQMLALSLLFNEVLKWTRKQTGSDDLRACLIVDECVGLLPPHPGNPPTKKALLLMLKQARAFGVGCILATQNPVDLDYKAMSNCETWLIGRLSMDKDRARVINGVCSNSSVIQSDIERKIAGLQARDFVFVRPDKTQVIRTRNVNCDLKGPMPPHEIEAMYAEGKFEYINPTMVLQQQLHMARLQFLQNPELENIQRVAELEQQLDVFGNGKLTY